MAATFDIIILTAFGQGYRLARDLAFEGRKVAWLDITAQLKIHSRETTGPFCSGVHPDATDLDRREFLQDHDFEEIPQGFSVLHGGQLLESRGDIVDYQKKQWAQPAAFDFLEGYCRNVQPPQWEGFQGEFRENWVLHLAAWFNKSRGESSKYDLASGKTLFPIFQPSFVPQENHSSRKKREQDLKVFGVQVLEAQDLKFRKDQETGNFYFYNKHEGMIESKNFVHFLTAWDLKNIDPTFYSQMHRVEPEVPEWHWQRIPVELDAKVDSSPVPHWLLCIEHWDLPWREENYFILRRDSMTGRWDLWTPVETAKISEPSYRKRLCHQLEIVLQERFHSVDSRVAFESTFQRNPVVPFPVFSQAAPMVSSTNFYACGADSLGSFDLYDRHRDQKRVYQLLQKEL